jgi:catechol-2,3-dioxygenase
VIDLKKAKENLEIQGIKTTEIQRKWSSLVFYCQDPEGHRLEFWVDDERNNVA